MPESAGHALRFFVSLLYNKRSGSSLELALYLAAPPSAPCAFVPGVPFLPTDSCGCFVGRNVFVGWRLGRQGCLRTGKAAHDRRLVVAMPS